MEALSASVGTTPRLPPRPAAVVTDAGFPDAEPSPRSWAAPCPRWPRLGVSGRGAGARRPRPDPARTRRHRPLRPQAARAPPEPARASGWGELRRLRPSGDCAEPDAPRRGAGPGPSGRALGTCLVVTGEPAGVLCLREPTCGRRRAGACDEGGPDWDRRGRSLEARGRPGSGGGARALASGVARSSRGGRRGDGGLVLGSRRRGPRRACRGHGPRSRARRVP